MGRYSVFLGMLVLSTFFVPASGETYHVKLDGSGDFKRIGGAMSVSVAGDEIIVHPGNHGVYGLQIKGVTVRSIDPNDPGIVERTVIGEDNYYYRFVADGPISEGFRIEGITFTGSAGVVRVMGSRGIIRNCIVRDNRIHFGSAIGGYDSSVKIENCSFIDNEFGYSVISFQKGYGEYEGPRGVHLKNCLIANNKLIQNGGENQAPQCIYIADCEGSIENCTIVDNVASTVYSHYLVCPGIVIQNGGVFIKNTIVWNNLNLNANACFPQIAIVDFPFGSSEPVESETRIQYSDVQGGKSSLLYLPDGESFDNYLDYDIIPDANLIDAASFVWGAGNIDEYPVFGRKMDDGGDGWFDDWDTEWIDESANNIRGDYHLQSAAGRFRWDGLSKMDINADRSVDLSDFGIFAGYWLRHVYNVSNYRQAQKCDVFLDGLIDLRDLYYLCEEYQQPRVFGAWVVDAMSSPCIDAGNPEDPGWGNEMAPHGGRINMGVYGGTAEASKSPNQR